MLGNTRKKVDKAHKEVKGTDRPKVARGGITHNPMQEIINKEAGTCGQYIIDAIFNLL